MSFSIWLATLPCLKNHVLCCGHCLNVMGQICQWHNSIISRNAFSLMAYKQVLNTASSKLLGETKPFPCSGRKVLSSSDIFQDNNPPPPQTSTHHPSKQKTTNQPKNPNHQVRGQEELLLLPLREAHDLRGAGAGLQNRRWQSERPFSGHECSRQPCYLRVHGHIESAGCSVVQRFSR